MNTKLILLVEDNADDEALSLRALAQCKLDDHTVVVRDGKEALDYLFYDGTFSDRPKDNPQIILLDLNLPKINGFDVLQKIRSHDSTQHIPVIMLTSSTEEKDKAECLGHGANNYMTKPIDIEQFNKIIQQFLLYWVGLNKGFI